MHAGYAGEALTRSVEDYLKTIYEVAGGGGVAATRDIAQALDLSPASVSGMVKRLSEQGLLEHAPYRGVQLTGEGRRVALRMVRRHRLIESYLVANLGYSWDTVHDEAERLEHAVSDALVERMAAALGHPGADPHGDPIPDANGEIAELASVPLAEVEPGALVEIRRVRAGDPELLRYLAGLGLTPGMALEVLAHEPFRGPVRVRIGETERVIGHEVAQRLLCARIEDVR